MKNKRFIYILLILAGMATYLWAQIYYRHDAVSAGIEIDFLDVGQGDAELVNLGNGEQALVDGGPNEDVILAQLGREMPPTDRKIEHIVLTHPHIDHLKGLIAVAQRYEIGEVIAEQDDYPGDNFQKWRDILKQNNVPFHIVRQGESFQWGEVLVQVLWPKELVENVNDNSIVLEFKYGSSGAILTGDAETNSLQSICQKYGVSLISQIVKASHHGSQNGANECFWSKTAPEYAIISVGKNNKYGHPHQALIDLVSKYAEHIFRTDRDGTVECQIEVNKVSCR